MATNCPVCGCVMRSQNWNTYKDDGSFIVIEDCLNSECDLFMVTLTQGAHAQLTQEIISQYRAAAAWRKKEDVHHA